MDSKTKIRVETIMEDLVEEGKMFTAYDLTKIIRAEVDQGVKIYHADVRALVNDIWFSDGQVFDDNNYTRSNIQIPGISMFAWIYHHSMTDPKTYDKDSLPEDNENKIPGNDPHGVLDSIDDDDDPLGNFVDPIDVKTIFLKPDDNILTPDARGRICIPKENLKHIGLTPGDIVYVCPSYSARCVSVSNVSQIPVDNIVKYIVDKSGNVRLSACIFGKAGMPTDNVVVYEISNNDLELESLS